MSEQVYDIFQAAQELDLSEGYIRLMVRQGVIKTTKVPIHEGSTVTKHVIKKSELYAFASREHARAPRRNDGRSKCTFYAMPEELEEIKRILSTSQRPGIVIVAETMQMNGKGDKHDTWTPPSQQKPKDS